MLEVFLSLQPLSSQSFGEIPFFPGQQRLPQLDGLLDSSPDPPRSMSLLDLRPSQGQGVEVDPSQTSAPTQAPRPAGLIVLCLQTRTNEVEFREEQQE